MSAADAPVAGGQRSIIDASDNQESVDQHAFEDGVPVIKSASFVRTIPIRKMRFWGHRVEDEAGPLFSFDCGETWHQDQREAFKSAKANKGLARASDEKFGGYPGFSRNLAKSKEQLT